MNGNETEKNVVLADDSLDDLLIFELALKDAQFGVRVRHAQDGTVLFILLEEEVPDMLFLDINMPCKDGITCLSEIRQNKQYDRMPIIMLTGNEMQQVVEDSYRKGANFYIKKTDTIKALSMKLQTIFKHNWKETILYPTLDSFVVN